MKKFRADEVEQTLITLTRQFLVESQEVQHREVRLDTDLQKHLGLDSLARAELFDRIGRQFGITLPDRLLVEADTLGDVAKYIQESAFQVAPLSYHKTKIQHEAAPALDPSHAKTLVDVLWLYGKQAKDRPHIYLQDEMGKEEILTYGQLLESALRVAQALRERGVMPGDTVAIMQPTHFGFFYTFFGTLLAGAVPVPIYPPFRSHALEAYAKQEARILRNAEVRILVTFQQAEQLSRLLPAFIPSLKEVTTVDALLQSKPLAELPFLQSKDAALIQYTSGSTNDPKGVLLNHSNLLANIRSYGQAVQVTPQDVVVSWLPLYHDMGLIGAWLGSLYYGVPLVLLSPFTFLNHPERWLWAFHYHRGTISAAPNFAYELCVRKLDPAVLEGLDLSSWRLAANGAEAVYPKTLEQFVKKFSAYGFKRGSLLPVYGLAESTVGLAVPEMGSGFRIDTIDRKSFEEKKQAIPSTDKNSLQFASCGKPLPAHEIRIVDQEDEPLPERHVGLLQFRGPSSMQGYYNNPEATAAVHHRGWWDSGDLAYLADGEVFITGRKKDLIIKAGRNIYPAEIEGLVGGVQGVRQGCVVAFSVEDHLHLTERLIVVAETREKNQQLYERITEAVMEMLSTALDIVPDEVVLVAPHTIPKTSSGKLQRSACKKAYQSGRLSKWHLPPVVQIAKLIGQSLFYQAGQGIRYLGKCFYTAYVALVLVLALPLLWLVVATASRRTAAAFLRQWARWLCTIIACRIKVVNVENLQKATPVIFAANHASYVDSLILISILPLETRFFAKKELFSVPFLKTLMHKLDYLPVDRLDLAKGLEDAKHMQTILQAGHPILVFPEGTFSYAAGLRPFKLGAFKMAVETKMPICPIALQGARQILRGEERLLKPGRVTVTVCEPIYPEGTEWQDITKLKKAVRIEIARYCGEPSLDFIAAETIASGKPPE